MSYIKWLRKFVQKKKVILVFATVIVEDAYRRILLQQRSDFAFWGLPGGIMELGEDIQTTARRELSEETGLSVGPLRLVGVYSDPIYDVIYPNGDAVQQFTVCFSGRMQGGVMRPDGVETTVQAFVAPQEALCRDLPPWYQKMVLDYITGGDPTFCPPFTGQETTDPVGMLRPLVGNQRLILAGATALVRNENGDILLVKRADVGAWVMPAGYADIGENVAHAALREVKEETGLDVTPHRLIGVYSDPYFYATYPNGDRVQNVGVLFDCCWQGGLVELNRTENVASCWVPAHALPERISPRFRLFATKIMSCLDEGCFVF